MLVINDLSTLARGSVGKRRELSVLMNFEVDFNTVIVKCALKF